MRGAFTFSVNSAKKRKSIHSFIFNLWGYFLPYISYLTWITLHFLKKQVKKCHISLYADGLKRLECFVVYSKRSDLRCQEGKRQTHCW